MVTEYLNRTATGSWTTVLPQTVPLIIVAQFCLFIGVRDAPHWFSAWAALSIGNSVMRVAAVALMAGYEVSKWPLVLAGIGTMMGGGLILKMGLK